jgi:hypothetical protein
MADAIVSKWAMFHSFWKNTRIKSIFDVAGLSPFVPKD